MKNLTLKGLYCMVPVLKYSLKIAGCFIFTDRTANTDEKILVIPTIELFTYLLLFIFYLF